LKLNPLCVTCSAEGRTTPAKVVDHRVPHRGDKDLFWNEGNWQPMCARCHNRKTAQNDGGFGRKPVEER
jgi:5-methylcytosine-specific restriction protein A